MGKFISMAEALDKVDSLEAEIILLKAKLKASTALLDIMVVLNKPTTGEVNFKNQFLNITHSQKGGAFRPMGETKIDE
jgi:hypothetical protein